MKKIKLFFGALAILFFVGITAKYLVQNMSQSKTIKVGIIGSDDQIWQPVAQRLQKKGIKIKLVPFTNFDQPNQALVSGDIDLNAYQHQYFLDNWNKAHKTNLTGIGATIIGPMAVFSNKIKSLNELQKQDVITIPNDATNQARALQMLEQVGLIKLKKNIEFPAPNDVVENKLKLQIKPLDAAQTARSLGDATATIVNNSVALDAKLNYQDAIYIEKITEKSKPWINVIVSQAKDKNNKLYQKIVKAYQSSSTATDIKRVYNGSAVPAWTYKFE